MPIGGKRTTKWDRQRSKVGVRNGRKRVWKIGRAHV